MAIEQALVKQCTNIYTEDWAYSLVSFQHRGLTEVVQASVRYFNTDEEFDHFINVSKQVLLKRV